MSFRVGNNTAKHEETHACYSRVQRVLHVPCNMRVIRCYPPCNTRPKRKEGKERKRVTQRVTRAREESEKRKKACYTACNTHPRRKRETKGKKESTVLVRFRIVLVVVSTPCNSPGGSESTSPWGVLRRRSSFVSAELWQLSSSLWGDCIDGNKGKGGRIRRGAH